MSRYKDLSDEELAIRIKDYRDKIDEAQIGGDVAVIAGEGRRMEVTRGNTAAAEQLLGLMLLEREKRENGGVLPGRALGVRIYK